MSPPNNPPVWTRTHDFEIQALVDGQLGWDAQKRFWREIESNPALQRRYDELVAQKRLLLQWWASEGAGKSLIPSLKDGPKTFLV